MLSMFDAQFHFAFRRGIGLELVSDHDARRFDGAFQKLRQDAARGVGVSSLLDENVERRIGQPSEVAAVIAFLVSDDASFISCQTINFDGGMLPS